MTTCESVQPGLVAYHAGVCEPVERDGIDAHLLGCRSCLCLYLDAKRASEDVPLGDALPSADVRARLRSEVRLLAPPAPVLMLHRARRTWVVGAAVAALALLAFALTRRPPPRAEPTLLIDSDQAGTSLTVL